MRANVAKPPQYIAHREQREGCYDFAGDSQIYRYHPKPKPNGPTPTPTRGPP
jgi:hypothetical protein